MSIQLTQQEARARLAALAPISELATAVFLEHADLPELHPAQQQEQSARDSATCLALGVIALVRELKSAAGIAQ